MIREDFLHQNAFHDEDTYTPIRKQFLMMKLVLEFYSMSLQAIEHGAHVEELLRLPVREQIGRFKYIPSKQSDFEYEKILEKMAVEIGATLTTGEDF